jgi:hypothetical protein
VLAEPWFQLMSPPLADDIRLVPPHSVYRPEGRHPGLQVQGLDGCLVSPRKDGGSSGTLPGAQALWIWVLILTLSCIGNVSWYSVAGEII